MDGDTNRDMAEIMTGADEGADSIEDIMLSDDGRDGGTDGQGDTDPGAADKPAEDRAGSAGTPTDGRALSAPAGPLEDGKPDGKDGPPADGKPKDGGGTDEKPAADAPADSRDPATPDGNPDEKQPETVLEVEFLGEKKRLTASEARTLVQKGLNYDHVAQQRDELKNAPERRLIESLAKQNGMKPEEYLRHAQQLADERADAEEYQRLISAGNKPETARELLKLRREAARKEAEREAARQQQEAEESRQRTERERRDADFRAFVKAYPDVKTLPDDVARAVAQGESVLTAYQRHENAELRRLLAEEKARAAAEQKKQENKNKNPGSLGSATPTEAPDPLDAALKEAGF